MTTRPLIVITNDDGIRSPGLQAAAEAVAPLGDVLIVAPHQQQSASGRSYPKMTDFRVYRHEITVAGKPVIAFSINGSPAQVAGVALIDLADRRPSLLVSGINFGENVGSGITASGTVGAALEAAGQRIPALAVSLQTPREYYYSYSDDIDFSGAAHFTQVFAAKIIAGGFDLPFDVDVLKIDVPAVATPDTTWRITQVSRQSYHYGLPSKPEKRGFWVEPDYATRIDEETLEADSDIRAVCLDEVVSVAPLSINLTSRVDLNRLQHQLNGDKSK